MSLFLLTIAWLFLLSCFFLVIGALYFTRENLTPGPWESTSGLPPLSVIVPARNEEKNIERCVASLLNQSYPEAKYHIIVVDDNSTDATASIVSALQAKHPNLELVRAGLLAEGWSGKNNACWKGVQHADGKWYCFIDADTQSKPELLETAVAFAEAKKIDMLSINPFQEVLSFSERLLLPGVFLPIACSMNFGKVNDPSKPEAAANGQFMLFRQTAYEAINGHRAVRDEVMEDMAFARVVKKAGLRLYWIFGEKLISTRMYRGLSHIWEGFSKNLTEIMRNRNTAGSMCVAVKSLLLGWMPIVMPLWTFFAQRAETHALHLWAFLLSAFGSASMLVLSVLVVRALRIPFVYVLSLPLGFTLHALLTISSLRNRKRGQRKWKGRVYS